MPLNPAGDTEVAAGRGGAGGSAQAGRQQTWARRLRRLPLGVLAGRQRRGAEPSCGRGRDGAGRRPQGARGPRVCCSPGGNRREVPASPKPRDSGPRRDRGMGEPAPRRALDRDLLLGDKPFRNPPEPAPSQSTESSKASRWDGGIMGPHGGRARGGRGDFGLNLSKMVAGGWGPPAGG